MPRAWHFLDHWRFDLSVSHLDSVTRREYFSTSKQRYRRSIELKGWKAFFYCSCRRHEALSVDGRGSNPILFGSFGIFNVRLGDCCRSGQRITQVVMTFPEGFRFSSCYRSVLSVFGSLTWRLDQLECRGGYELPRTSVATYQWSIDAPKSRKPWNIPTMDMYVERWWRWFNDIGAEAWSFSWRYEVSGAPIPFSLKFGKFIYLNQENSICDLLPRCSALSDSQPSIDRGIEA